jgi:hypothetical protein
LFVTSHELQATSRKQKTENYFNPCGFRSRKLRATSHEPKAPCWREIVSRASFGTKEKKGLSPALHLLSVN